MSVLRIERVVYPYERAEVIDMRVQHPVIHTSTRWRVSALALACAFTAPACSAEYPIGNVEERGQLVDGEATSATEVVARSSTPGLLGAADSTFELGPSFDWYGPAVPVGDLDGDGSDDTMLVESDFAGRVTTLHLLYGGARPSGDDLLTFEPQRPRLLMEGRIGGSSPRISVAGDVDGDGFVDVLVRTDECEPTQPGEGAYLLYGGPERLRGSLALSSAAVHFVPPQLGALQPDQTGCGSSASPALGDLDGDGFADLMLQMTPGLSSQKEAVAGTYLFYGRAERFAPGTPFTSADAWLRTPSFAGVKPAKDINGDSRPDLLMGNTNPILPGNHTFFLPGDGERLTGTIDVEKRAVLLSAHFGLGSVEPVGTLDVNADGLSDVLLEDLERNVHLFYGAPGLFADGIDFSHGVPFSAGFQPMPAGDLDGDGDTELLHLAYDEDVALLGAAVLAGQAEPFAGPISFATPPHTVFEEPDRVLYTVYPAGDLDGDGAGDVFSVSNRRVFDDMPGFQLVDTQLHIHYGRLALPPAPRLR